MALLSLTPYLLNRILLYLYITQWRKNAKKYFDPLRSKSEKKVMFHKLKKKAVRPKRQVCNFIFCHRFCIQLQLEQRWRDFYAIYDFDHFDSGLPTNSHFQHSTIDTIVLAGTAYWIDKVCSLAQKFAKKNSARLDRKSLGHVVFRHLNDQSSNGS